MNTFYRYLVAAFIFTTLASCATGKNAFDKGDYVTALDKAVNRLKANPNNKKAKEVLIEGYQYASTYHLNRIREFNRSADRFKWERIFSEYALLNRYYRDITGCPACMDAVNPQSYFGEQEKAAFEAADVLVALGKEELEFNTVETGRQAYSHFQSAVRFNPNFNGIDSLLNVALDMGTLKVLIAPIPVHSRNLEITNAYFANRMIEYFDQFSRGKFLQFITGEEALNYDIQPDHVISMVFDDFALGQQLVEKETREIQKDSVIVGTYTDDEGVAHDVLGTVKADLTLFKKTLSSAGVLNFEVRDAYSNRILVNRKFASEDVWTYQWASFNGDERALTTKELRLTEKNELAPPSPQVLFGNFIDRIYDQAIEQIREIYRNNDI